MDGGGEDRLGQSLPTWAPGQKGAGEGGSEERLTSELGVLSRQPREERAAAAAESKQRVWPGERRRGGRGPRPAQSFPLGFPGFVAQGGSRKGETLRVMGGGRGEK